MTTLEEWWAQGAFIDIDGNRIFTSSKGEGPLLIFLHGFPTSSHDWVDVIDDLSRDYRCVTFDYLGYGASDKPKDADYSSFKQTDRVLETLKFLGIARARIIAHDLGGILLQQMIFRSGQENSGLVIDHAVFSNSSVFPDLYRPTPMQVALVDPAEGKALARQISQPMLEASLASLFPARPPAPERITDLWKAISRDEGQLLWPEHLVYMQERAEQGSDWVDEMRRTLTPMSFIYGLADEISGAQILTRAGSDLLGSDRIGLDGLGHYPHVESPADFASALRATLMKFEGDV